MTWPPGLELLEMIIADHRRDRGGTSELVPCVHEDLEGDIDLLASGARRCGGVLFNLNASDDDWEPPPVPIVRDRQAVLAGVLGDAVGDALPVEVIIEEDARGVVAHLAGGTYPAEPSLVLILRAVAVVASSAYDQFDMVVTAVSLASMDARRRELLWRILALDPRDLSIKGAPTTLVPILGSVVDPETDYRRNPGVRYVVRLDRVIRRSKANLTHAIETIASLDDRPLVVFLGAGASASSGIPLGNTYRDMALEQVVGRHASPLAAAEAFFDLLHERDHFMSGETDSRAVFAAQLTLERVLQEIFVDLGYRPRTDSAVIREIVKDCDSALGYLRPGRIALRDLASRLHGRLVIATVNFDELVETGLGVDASVYFRPEHFKSRLEELKAYVRGESGKPLPILKLHGSIHEPDSMIATIDSTSAGLNDHVRNALNALLDSTEKPLRWIWIGCSMRDRDINLWLGGLGASALDEWWVDPLPGQSLTDFFDEHRAPSWRQMNRRLSDRLALDSADGFLRALAESVSTA